MLGAAPRVRRFRGGVVAAACAVLVLPLAPSAATFAGAGAAGSAASVAVWAVQLPASSRVKLSPGLFAQLRAAGVGTLVVQRSGWPAGPHRQLVALAGKAKTRLVEPRQAPQGVAGQKALRAACALGGKTSLDRCAVQAASAPGARAWLKRGSVDFVVVRVASPAGFLAAKWPASRHGRLIAVVPLAAGKPASGWQSALSAGKAALLAAAPQAIPSPAFSAYLSLLQASLGAAKQAAGVADTSPPGPPGNPTLIANSVNSLTVAWQAASDDVAVSGYEIFLDGVSKGTTSATATTLTGLDCQTTYTVGVEALDAAGNHSQRASIDATTQYGCLHPGGGGSPGSSLPAPPGNLSLASAGRLTLSIAWTAPAGAISGYRVFLNSILTANTSSSSYTYTGLTCNTSYTVSVAAYDASGASSTQTSASFKTAACPPGSDTTPPSPPGPLNQGATTTTSIAFSWAAATDNLAVTGYTIYKNGVAAGTSTTTSTTLTALTCGTSYTLGVEATDAANNHSTRTTLIAATSSCPAGDTSPPSSPGSLSVGSASQTSISLGWAASSDNVAVSGYGIYKNGVLLATQPGTSYSVTGLSCGSSYTLAVDAYDAAGNHSPKASTTASTSVCPSSGSASVFMAPAGSDANPCTQARPCRSFDRAYHVAASGATVEVAAGSYGGETINADSSKTSAADVVFTPASGASVTVTDTLDVHAAHLEWRDMTVQEFNFPREADDVTVRNVVNHGVWMQGASNISIIGGEISCGFCAYHSHIENGGGDSAPPRNILFDGVSFHDWHSVSGEHTECLQILGGDNVTIRNSTFKNCGTGNGGLGATGDLFVGFLGGTGPVTKNILLENNFFYPSGNNYAIQMSDLENLDLRYNSIASPIIIFDREGPGTGMDMIGNIMRYSGCTAESNGVPINWRYNITQGGTCSPTDKNAAAGFIDNTSNLHLATGSAAINAGDPTSYPSHDIDGQTRPRGTAADAGADETG